MQLAFARLDDRLLYGLKVYDDPEKAGLLWSVLERDEEKSALAALTRGEHCQTFLFNEVAANAAWSAIGINFTGADLSALLEGAVTGPVDHSALKGRAAALFDRIHGATNSDSDLIAERWSHLTGQNGGLAKVDSGFDYAANFSSFACVA